MNSLKRKGGRSFRSNLSMVSAVGFATLSIPVCGAEYFLDPEGGNLSGDGSVENPWPSLEAVVTAGMIETGRALDYPYVDGAELQAVNAGAPIQAGDTLWLLTGYHGELNMTGAYNAEMITIAAAPGHTPRLRRVFLRGAGRWTLRGLSISLSHAEVFEKATLVDLDSHGWHGPAVEITVEDCDVFTVPDISSWTIDDWNALVVSGIYADGRDCRIIGNRVRNVRFAIQTLGERALVSGNRITNFAGDGIRGIGDFSTYEYNLIENCYDIDDNHDDGFQSWSIGDGGVGTGEVRGVVLRGNIIINNRDPNQPLRGPLQGFGCFDGQFVDWVVENNVICVDHFHGITLLGAMNCRIVNNTVVDTYTRGVSLAGPAWIMVDKHKDGRRAMGNTVANNFAHSYTIGFQAATVSSNITFGNPALYFEDPTSYDFRLKPFSGAIGTADPELAPAIDALGLPRSDRPDVGGIEYQEHPMPADFRMVATSGQVELLWNAVGRGLGYDFGLRRSSDLNVWSDAPAVERMGSERRLVVTPESSGVPTFIEFDLQPEASDLDAVD